MIDAVVARRAQRQAETARFAELEHRLAAQLAQRVAEAERERADALAHQARESQRQAQRLPPDVVLDGALSLNPCRLLLLSPNHPPELLDLESDTDPLPLPELGLEAISTRKPKHPAPWPLKNSG